jgi:molybdopterin-guanine dinucleotide biosynthesis protein A
MIEAVIGQVSSVCRTTIVVGRDLRSLRAIERPGVQLVRDRFRTPHPLGGLFTALDLAPTSWVFLAACDTPLLRTPLVHALWRSRRDAHAVAAHFSGRLQPFAALYHRDCLPVIRNAIDAGDFSLQAVLEAVKTRILPSQALAAVDPEGLSFRDADTPAALRDLQAFADPVCDPEARHRVRRR